ncbi:hypothetical protein Peur_010785 [Populus x canadensis]
MIIASNIFSFLIFESMLFSINNIKKYIFHASLRAQVCRVWVPKLNDETSSFNCLFVVSFGQMPLQIQRLPPFANAIRSIEE